MGKKGIISEVIFKKKNIPPVILNFKNGALKPQAMSGSQCGIYRDNEEPEKYVVAMCTPTKLLYMGKEPVKSDFRTMLAIQDKGSNKVRLVEVDEVAIQAIPVKTTQKSSVNASKTYGDLNKAFGSKRMKRHTEIQERMAIDVDTVEDRLKVAASSANIDDNEAVMNAAQHASIFVPCNREAVSVDAVYNLWDIISEEELDSLHEEAEYVWNNLSTIKEYYSQFFCNCIEKLPADNKMYRTKVLLYADCIINFLKVPNELRKKNPLVCPKSPVINNKVLETFTEGTTNGRSCSSVMKDKAICTVIVLGLTAMKFILVIEPLAKDLKITFKRLLSLCRIVGAVSVYNDRTTVVLKLPLPPVPKPSLRQKGGRK